MRGGMEGAQKPVPDRQNNTKIPVKMPGVARMMKLMLGRGDENPLKRRRIAKGNMRMAQIGAKPVKDEDENADAIDGQQINLVAKQTDKQRNGDALYAGSAQNEDHPLDRMRPGDGERGQGLSTMVEFVKLPEGGNAVHQIMHAEAGKIIKEEIEQREAGGGQPVINML